MKCKYCGREIPDDSNFCEFCGKKVIGSKRWAWYVVILLVVAVGALIVSLLVGGGTIPVNQENTELAEVVAEVNTEVVESPEQAASTDDPSEQVAEAVTKVENDYEKHVSPSGSSGSSGEYGQTIGTSVPRGYIDLGLPSGTYWKALNESGFYTYDEAVSRFGSNLPSGSQFQELKDYCHWTWTGSGYKVVGPNGNSIVFPAAGYRNCDGSVYYVGENGDYWSSTASGSEEAMSLYFYSGGVDLGSDYCCHGGSVRLVQD